ncbi:MAG TPA: type II toxin-antitoxin system Phd/YefM family antitoxin [Gemmata sp.]|nr:type II toxin-antitoxin system Phd/YefM family antitoxin [Gemmata sp.]
MLDIANDIQSLSTFKRDTARMAARLKKTGQPIVLTVNGKAELVVQDAAAYQKLLEIAALAERAEMAAFLKQSRDDMNSGRTIPARKFLESLGKKKS